MSQTSSGVNIWSADLEGGNFGLLKQLFEGRPVSSDPVRSQGRRGCDRVCQLDRDGNLIRACRRPVRDIFQEE